MFVPLRAPAVEIQETLNAEGRLTLLLGRLATLMGDNSVFTTGQSTGKPPGRDSVAAAAA